MKQLRLVLVTRRFWPLTGGLERLLGHLVDGFQQRGLATTVLTAQWDKHWPRKCVHREVPVVRLPLANRLGWGKVRFLRTLSRWLREHRSQFDLALVSGLKEDAYAVAGIGARIGLPAILRAECAGTSGDCDWQRRARFGRRIQRRCQTARAIVATSKTAAGELLESGYDSDRVHYVANGLPTAMQANDRRREAARDVLADAHPVFKLPRQAPLAVYAGRFQKTSDLESLVEAWRSVARRWPAARLWLLGDGNIGPKIWQRVKDLELTGQVIFPGQFDDMDVVLQAANLLVYTNRGGCTVPMLEAMAAGVPVVAADSAAARELIDDGMHGVLVPPSNVAALNTAIQALLLHDKRASDCGLAGQQRVRDQFSLEQMVQGHLELFKSCLAPTAAIGTGQTPTLC